MKSPDFEIPDPIQFQYTYQPAQPIPQTNFKPEGGGGPQFNYSQYYPQMSQSYGGYQPMGQIPYMHPGMASQYFYPQTQDYHY